MRSNVKQILFSAKKVRNARFKLFTRMFFCLFALMFITSVGIAIETGDSGDCGSVALSAVIGMAAIGNFDEVGEKEKAPNQVSDRIYLVEVRQLDALNPWTYNEAAFAVSALNLKPGEFMHYAEVISDSFDDTSTGEKGDITLDVTNTVTFLLGGESVQLRKFLQEKAGCRFLIIYEYALTGQMRIMGHPKKAMVFKKFERKNGKEGVYASISFESKSFDQPKDYTGAIVLENPAALAADATTLTVSANNRYSTGSNTVDTTLATVAGLAEADWGRIIEINGVGGEHPTKIADNDVFVLVNGQTWTGNNGSKLVLKVIDSVTLVEIDRIQTAA